MMGQFHTIVACTDFSAVGDRAIAAACELGERDHAHLIVVHVIEPIPPPPPPTLLVPVMPLAGAEDYTALRPEVLKQLEHLVPDEPQVEKRVELGDPVREILRVAEQGHADLIVVGTHGRHGPARWILGSTAERVVRRAHCPVLVVH